MNQLLATVIDIRGVERLKHIKLDVEGYTLDMLSLELDSSIEIGKEVVVSIKPTHIGIHKSKSISSDNQLRATIISSTNGEILSSVRLKIDKEVLESIILLESYLDMGLDIGDEVEMIINPTKLSIVGVR